MVVCKLSELMGKFRLTKVKIAEETNINRNTITYLYQDTLKRVDLTVIDRLCKYFREVHGFPCQVSDLLQYVPDTK